ncbi:MAG: DUF1015 domain-containing protein [Planctomycetes bacterium]|nr:DUF1015 domain-containing protein [Planctomycetota bacterium]
MSDIKPFRAYRPRPDLVQQVACPPYDVLSSEEARRMAAGNPVSFLHVNKPEIDLDPAIDLHDDRVYLKGAENLRRFIAEEVLIREAAPAFYVYQQIMGEHRQAGIVAGASVEEYETDLIRKHEFTRRDKEDDRTRHTDELNANAGPVFLTYRPLPEIDALVDEVRLEPALYDFTADDGIRHTVWAVIDPATIAGIAAAFARIPCCYVADGHHRSASAARVGRRRREENPHHTGREVYNYFLAVFFPADQLQIMDYNRVVKDLNGREPAAFLDAVRETFEVVAAADGPPVRPAAPNDFGMFLGNRWYRLTARPGTFPADDPVRRLDVSILQENLIGPVLGIQDPRTDKRIDFVGGIRGLGELERRVREGWAVAFALHPTTIEQLLSVADAGRVMPPKSTWFEPKLRSGILVRSLAED